MPRNPGRPVENPWKKHKHIISHTSPHSHLPKFRYSILSNPLYLQLLINTSPATFLEMGCNDGLDSQKILQIFPNGRLICFEPEPRAIEQFHDRMDEYKDRCSLFHVAIGAKNGRATFHQSSGTKENTYKDDWDLSGSLNEPTGHLSYSPWVKFNNQIEVEVHTLDSFFTQKGFQPPSIVDLFWLDVQGGERNVMLGGKETLKRTRFIYTEFGHWKKPLYDGQMSLRETIEELGEDWEPLAIFENCNLLAVNKELVYS